MNISDIASREYLEVEPDERLGKLQSTLGDAEHDAVLVVEDGECVGVVTTRDVLRSQYSDEAKAEGAMRSPPRLERTTDVREAARMLVEGGVRVAPVYESDELWGALTQDDLLAAVRENLSVLDVGDVQTDEVVTATPEMTLGTAIDRLRENGVSRLPVVREDGRLTGILTTTDVVDFIIRVPERTGKGDRAGDDTHMLDLPVRDLMSEPAETTTPETSLDEAVEVMLEEEYDGLVVTPEYEELVAGVVTKTDVVRALTYSDEDRLDVHVTNVDLLRTTSRDELYQQVESITRKDEKLDVQSVELRFTEHEESRRGQSLVRCRARLRSDEANFITTGEGYGAEQALSLALDRLERRLVDMKGRRGDEEYEGQLLRKLDQL